MHQKVGNILQTLLQTNSQQAEQHAEQAIDYAFLQMAVYMLQTTAVRQTAGAIGFHCWGHVY
jgi:uncharacterized membrane protein YhdT